MIYAKIIHGTVEDFIASRDDSWNGFNLEATLAEGFLPYDVPDARWLKIEGGVVVAYDASVDIAEEERQRLIQIRTEEIKLYALHLISQRIPALSTFEMVGLLKELWGHLVSPASNHNLAYCGAVYSFADQRIAFAKTASRVQLESYVVGADTWP